MKRIASLVASLAVASTLLAETRSVTFEVKGWSCGSCASATRIALKKLEGVTDVSTDVGKAEAVVTYDEGRVTPQKMIEAVEKIGYKATIKTTAQASATSAPSTKANASNGPQAPEGVSFFEVALECGAAERLGCGSASKPVLKALEKDPRVKGAKINYPGTLLAVEWNDPEQSDFGASAVAAVFKARGLETTILRGQARDTALKEYGHGRWYGAAEVDRLSEREAQVIAERLVNRAKPQLGLGPEKLAALTKDLSKGIATILTRDKDEECVRDPFEELTELARKHLNSEQMAELRKAAEKGAGALPGEAK